MSLTLRPQQGQIPTFPFYKSSFIKILIKLLNLELYEVLRLKSHANYTCLILTLVEMHSLLYSDEIDQIVLVAPPKGNFSNFVLEIIKGVISCLI